MGCKKGASFERMADNGAEAPIHDWIGPRGSLALLHCAEMRQRYHYPYSCLEMKLRSLGWCGVGLSKAPYKPMAPTICNLLFLHGPPSTNTASNRPIDPGILPIIEGFESWLSWHVDGRKFCFSNNLASGAFWRWSESCQGVLAAHGITVPDKQRR